MSEGHLLGEQRTVRGKKRKPKHRKRRVRLGLVAALDAGIGPIKQRERGLTGGQLLVGMAIAQFAGQDCLAGMDRVRADQASTLLTEAPVTPSTTAGRLAGCFGPARLLGIEAGLAQAELPLAMDLMAGNDDVRPPATDLLRRALAVLPAQVCGRPRVRADAGSSRRTSSRSPSVAAADHVWAASFIVTNIPANDTATPWLRACGTS